MSDRDHFVYEAFDADGLLLYVGCTGQPDTRYRAHMAGNYNLHGWFNPFVTRWRVSGPYPKVTAYAIERERIARQQPIWNGHSRDNRGGRGLIAEYLKFHGVRFQAVIMNGKATRAQLVKAAS